MVFVSPIHIRFKPFDENDLRNNLDKVIEVFQASIDGWYLEIADRCINGWQQNGQHCINTRDRQGRTATYIPDSAFAVLMIVFNYFELIGVFKRGIIHRNQTYEKFLAGVDDIFSELPEQERKQLSKRMYKLRTQLYHVQKRNTAYSLRHTIDSPDAAIDSQGVLVIDPHKLVPRLRSHFRLYCAVLRDHNQTETRQRFRNAYEFVYFKK